MKKSPSTNSSVDLLSYEQALAELETIVAALEAGEDSLETALSLYERGQALSQHCTTLLGQAELKVRQLAGEDLVDFEPREG